MKILLSRSSTDQVVGGAELSARDITRALITLGHQPLLATNIRKSIITKKLPADGVMHPPFITPRNRKLRRLVKPVSSLVHFIWYLLLIKKFKPDIINPQSRDDQVLLTKLGRLLRIPVVWRDPGDLRPQLEFEIKGFWQKLNRRSQIRAIEKTDHIFTLNSDDRQAILRLVPSLAPERISTVGSNILFEDYSVDPVKTSSKLTLGTVSRLDKHKGVQYLLAAFNTLQTEYDGRFRLIVAGDGDYRSELEQLAKNIPGVEFTGNITDVSKLFNQIDIFVQPSEFEGWGRNVKEAMLFGLPIVGSRVGGIKKQIDHQETGLLFESKNPQALLTELRKLIESPELRYQLGVSAKQKAEADGDWVDTLKREVLPLFEKYSTRPKIRIESGSFISAANYSGVGYYSKMLTESFSDNHITHLITGPFKRFTFGNKTYNKLASYGLAWPVDLFMKPVDLTILPNFAYWPTIKSRQTAVVIHDLTYLYFPELVEKKNLAYLRRVVPRAVKKADSIITVSESVKSELIKEFGIDGSNIIVTHIPADKRFEGVKDADIHTKYKLPTKKFIFFVGNMEPRKNLTQLIRAYLRLDPKLKSEYSLVMGGGKGWNSSDAQQLIDQAQQDNENVIHVGYIDDEDLPSFYKKASLFVMPSLYEGFGMPVLEAISSGTPVLVADIPVLRETGGNAAIYVDPKDTEAMTQKIKLILTDDNIRSTLTKKAASHLLSFSWKNNIDAITKRLTQKN